MHENVAANDGEYDAIKATAKTPSCTEEITVFLCAALRPVGRTVEYTANDRWYCGARTKCRAPSAEGFEGANALLDGFAFMGGLYC